MSFEISQVVITIVVVCLFLWRISYGTNNGLFAEAAGLIAVIAAFVAVYYIMTIAGSVIGNNFGEVIPKIGYLVVTFIVYRVMVAIGRAFSSIKEIPILGKLDRLLGAIMGAAEAYLIIYIVEYITGMDIFGPVIEVWKQLYSYVMGLIQR